MLTEYLHDLWLQWLMWFSLEEDELPAQFVPCDACWIVHILKRCGDE